MLHAFVQSPSPGVQHISEPTHCGEGLSNVTLWLFNIAMENGPFIDGLPIKNGNFPWLC
jgi:hypothetical protein